MINETGFKKLPRQLPVRLFVDHGRAVQSAAGVATGEVVIVDRDARIVWIQTGVDSASLMRLKHIIGDLANGVDVPTRLRTQWQSDQDTYEAVLNAEVKRWNQR